MMPDDHRSGPRLAFEMVDRRRVGPRAIRGRCRRSTRGRPRREPSARVAGAQIDPGPGGAEPRPGPSAGGGPTRGVEDADDRRIRPGRAALGRGGGRHRDGRGRRRAGRRPFRIQPERDERGRGRDGIGVRRARRPGASPPTIAEGGRRRGGLGPLLRGPEGPEGAQVFEHAPRPRRASAAPVAAGPGVRRRARERRQERQGDSGEAAAPAAQGAETGHAGISAVGGFAPQGRGRGRLCDLMMFELKRWPPGRQGPDAQLARPPLLENEKPEIADANPWIMPMTALAVELFGNPECIRSRPASPTRPTQCWSAQGIRAPKPSPLPPGEGTSDAASPLRFAT